MFAFWFCFSYTTYLKATHDLNKTAAQHTLHAASHTTFPLLYSVHLYMVQLKKGSSIQCNILYNTRVRLA